MKSLHSNDKWELTEIQKGWVADFWTRYANLSYGYELTYNPNASSSFWSRVSSDGTGFFYRTHISQTAGPWWEITMESFGMIHNSNITDRVSVLPYSPTMLTDYEITT